MALNRDCLGREYESAEPYEVTRGKIAEFAAAIGDPNPLYRNPAMAGEYGYTDVLAPPTFPIVLGSVGLELVVADAELGLDFSTVVHGSQKFDYTRPLLAGDVVRTLTRISEIKSLGKTEMLTLSSEVTDVAQQHVVTALSVLVVRGEATEDGGSTAMGEQPTQITTGTRIPEATYTLRREDLVRYAGASGDFNPIHWSERVAKHVGLPDVIAHGMLTMAEAVRPLTDWIGDPGRLESYEVRFAQPVVVPDTDEGTEVTVGGTVIEVRDDGRAVVEITAVSDGRKVLTRSHAVVRLP